MCRVRYWFIPARRRCKTRGWERDDPDGGQPPLSMPIAQLVLGVRPHPTGGRNFVKVLPNPTKSNWTSSDLEQKSFEALLPSALCHRPDRRGRTRGLDRATKQALEGIARYNVLSHHNHQLMIGGRDAKFWSPGTPRAPLEGLDHHAR